ncbi:hypothetical protein Agabi119p4_7975 [Agaricus bisporus var. burnettii]|uniref:Uncharacterized protein n=1 Tax=Agaricus bisporus var. burnettii TaxID=192524 RepID=A0A8H7EY06_AGABI|nr:hypothetical protein Agabi119p4_7975 [Agaricus bisporus var. burnettii]
MVGFIARSHCRYQWDERPCGSRAGNGHPRRRYEQLRGRTASAISESLIAELASDGHQLPRDDSWTGRSGASPRSTASNAKLVGDKVPVDEEGSIGSQYCRAVFQIKPCWKSKKIARKIIRTPCEARAFKAGQGPRMSFRPGALKGWRASLISLVPPYANGPGGGTGWTRSRLPIASSTSSLDKPAKEACAGKAEAVAAYEKQTQFVRHPSGLERQTQIQNGMDQRRITFKISSKSFEFSTHLQGRASLP